MEELMNDIEVRKPGFEFLDHFENIDFSFDSSCAEIREEAKEIVHSLDFPTSKTEYWKYTRVTSLLKKKFHIGPGKPTAALDNFRFKELTELVFINGFFYEGLSTISEESGITVMPISKAKESEHPVFNKYFANLTKERKEIFANINSAFHNDGVFIFIDKNCQIDKGIHVLNMLSNEGNLANPRNLIIADTNSNCTVVESYCGEENSSEGLFNSVSEIHMKEGAQLNHYKIQDLGNNNHQISTEEIHQDANSNYQITTLTISGKLVRNNLNSALLQPGAECHYNGLYLTKDRQHVDNHTLIDHVAPNCESHELYKGILNERSKAVFNGRVLVRREAQKTNAFQSNANLLLTDNAVINSKPELEIYADDVKCSHGSTTGQLDENALFYLQARGISEDKARNLLLYAFAAEVLEHIDFEPLKEKIDHYIAARYNNAI